MGMHAYPNLNDLNTQAFTYACVSITIVMCVLCSHSDFLRIQKLIYIIRTHGYRPVPIPPPPPPHPRRLLKLHFTLAKILGFMLGNSGGTAP